MKRRQALTLLTLFLSSALTVTSCKNPIDSVRNLQAGTGKQIIILGDSIASGYGVTAEQAFPAVLSRELGLPIVNRGVAGDTTAMGLARLQTDVLAAEPWLVIVELGGNDFLRRIPKAETEQNLRQIVTQIQQQGAIAVLLGINAGLGGDGYKEIYQRVATDTQAYLIPQILRGILDNPQYRQNDVIHPNAAGHQVLALRVAEGLKPLLDKAKFPSNLSKP